MTTLKEIEVRAEAYDLAREHLKGLVQTLTDGIGALHREQLPAIRRAVKRAAAHHDALRSLIESSPELFVKPRTLIMHGIRLGYQKGKGALEWDDEERVLQRIRSQLPEQAEYLIACKYAPVRDSMLRLPAADLKKLGVRIAGDGDEIVIRPVDGAVEKVANALLKSAIDEGVMA